MKKKFILSFFVLFLTSLTAGAQKVDPKVIYTDTKGIVQETTSIDDGQAPLEVTFRANPSEMDDYTPAYEWHFRRMEGSNGYEELFVRYEEDTQYTFNESGNYVITLKTKLENEDIDIDSVDIKIFVAESWLEFPNAFSPNGDGINDEYKAKDGYKSIVEFHAYIINRWGQRLFDWTDISKGWDGTYRGKDCKDGVYFVIVKARGADGKEYNIRKDVNLLRKYTEGGNTGGN
jgi:gliding motility-associated-like protein